MNMALLRQEKILEKAKTRKEIVLDIGCGPGYLISRLGEKRDLVVGLDAQRNFIRCDKVVGVRAQEGSLPTLLFEHELGSAR